MSGASAQRTALIRFLEFPAFHYFQEILMSSAFLDSLREYALHHAGGSAQSLANFVSAYFESADPDELEARGNDTLFAMASAHARLLQTPVDAVGARIRVFNPTLSEDGFSSEHTLIQIVQDDMPFLVDSVTMAVNRSGRVAHWIVHPLLVLEQDTGAGLQQVSSAHARTTPSARVQSFIMVECDRIVLAQDRQALADDLLKVLGDVRAAVADWSAMGQRMQHVCEEGEHLSQATPQRQEGVAFLRWLEQQNFVFLGARDYRLQQGADGVELQAVPDSGLGILRAQARTPLIMLAPDVQGFIASDDWVMITKAMTRSTVHRPAWLDLVMVKRFDAQGQLIGESRFLGLYTSRAYAASVDQIPLARHRAHAVMVAAAVVAESHAAKSLQTILNTYPRDELMQADTATLIDHAVGILRLQEHQRTRIFLRRDPFGRFTSVLVYVPRDRYNTELRSRIGDELLRALAGQSLEYTPMLTDQPLARIHYLVLTPESEVSSLDVVALEARIASLARRWEDDCRLALLLALGESDGIALSNRFSSGFSSIYRADFSAEVAAQDAQVLAALTPQHSMAVRLYRPLNAPDGAARLKIFNTTKVALSDSLPVLERMGARVLDEQPYKVTPSDGSSLWIHDLGLQLPAHSEFAAYKDRFEALFLQVWHGEVDSDDLNQLVLLTPLDGRSISVLRAYIRYFRQLGFAYSQSYIETTLCKNAALTGHLAALFDVRFNPNLQGDRAAQQQDIQQRIETELRAVLSLEEDHVLRQLYQSILATLRTNAWQTGPEAAHKPYLSFKFDSRVLPGVPAPRPMAEIWVYSPRFEAVHLRNDKVARGGLRWSDRREDFRTEILGLVKAQQVKNTVIVPVGSKGGFVLKKGPSSAERDAWMAEGIACYRLFLSGLLDLTDNLVNGSVVPPEQVVRHDPDDPYLVVAADKGTASFSDIANAVSEQYGYWLGDAFASGGSVGYDHKKMGITARGAWESAKRHFRALGRDIQTSRFTVIGIGDMSGDVFGNGMLLSEHIALVAAFDHRHIFIDPQPDVAACLAERRRLFALPRSSWDDFDKRVLSEGGGVYPRSAKSITLSPQAAQALGLEAVAYSPNALLHALLQAPVDMIYNGGIGTYVKASYETHAQVGDKAGDAYRVDGKALRCKVLVEGGNLGCTQKGRIEFAQQGGLIYTDAIDNSAGVDCSDHEVNIKILLDRVVEAGDMTLKQRNDLLASMTDEVSRLVLTDNYYQTQALDVVCHRPLYFLDGQQRLIQWLEGAGRLDRAIEFLPSDQEFAQRRASKQGLTAPENAVLLAYAKMAIFDDLVASDLPDDAHFTRALTAYFPRVLSEKYADAIRNHPLRREIVATVVANTVVNRMGATFVNFLAAESVAKTADVVRAYTLAREIFGLEAQWDQIDALDHQVTSALQLDLLSKLMAVAQRASRWMMRWRGREADLPALIARYQPAAQTLRANLAEWLPENLLQNWKHAIALLQQGGVATELAEQLTALEFLFPALDLVDVSQDAPASLEQTARAYFAVDVALGLQDWRSQINRLPTDTLWQTQARASARDEVYAIAAHITRTVLTNANDVSQWAAQHETSIARLRKLLDTIARQNADLAPISVALRELRQMA